MAQGATPYLGRGNLPSSFPTFKDAPSWPHPSKDPSTTVP